MLHLFGYTFGLFVQGTLPLYGRKEVEAGSAGVQPARNISGH